jgi:hypothetical protein
MLQIGYMQPYALACRLGGCIATTLQCAALLLHNGCMFNIGLCSVKVPCTGLGSFLGQGPLWDLVKFPEGLPFWTWCNSDSGTWGSCTSELQLWQQG